MTDNERNTPGINAKIVDMALTPALQSELDHTGYYPQLVADALAVPLGNEAIVAHLVHLETTFDTGTVHRHLTVLVLTRTRLILVHVDDRPSPGGTQAMVSTEAVSLTRVSSVVTSQIISDPEAYAPGQMPTEMTLSLGLGVVSRVDIEPAQCGDPNCSSDHGLTGAVVPDDLTLRVSADAEGDGAVRAASQFIKALSRAVVGCR